jgi:hypothetical protein
MSRNIICVVMYLRHKLLDLVNYITIYSARRTNTTINDVSSVDSKHLPTISVTIANSIVKPSSDGRFLYE